MISKEEMDNLASLARLALSAEEKDRLRTDLAAVLEYVSQLPEDSAQQSTTKPQVFNVLREDEIKPLDEEERESLLKLFSRRKNNYLAVKKIFNDGGQN